MIKRLAAAIGAPAIVAAVLFWLLPRPLAAVALPDYTADPQGKGVIANITPHGEGLQAWSAKDIAYYLESGFTPDFDTVSGSMVAVQENMARLSADDRAAIAAYLKAVPARPNGYGKTEAAK